MELRLPGALRLEADYYCLRHGSGNSGSRLRSWELQGAVDEGSSSWVTLRAHRDDGALANEAFATAAWAVEGGKGAFQRFRVLQTGKGSTGYNFLCCAGIELYGTLEGAAGWQ